MARIEYPIIEEVEDAILKLKNNKAPVKTLSPLN
jgi:hypothetical protein